MYSQYAYRDRSTPLCKADSIGSAVLQRFDSSASSSYAYLRQDTFPRSVSESEREDIDGVERGQAAGTPIGLEVSIRFGRLGAYMALTVSVLVALTITFNRGVVVGHFDPTGSDPSSQKKMLDDYNSYTANVVSLFGRPIEVFVALAVQVVLLRLLAASLMRTEISWKMDVLTLIISAGVGYLISNGLNALNVQLQQPLVAPVISAVDLSYVPDFSMSDAASQSTDLTHTMPEEAQGNPITNTVLRNLVLPPVSFKKPFCDWESSRKQMKDQFFPILMLEYGLGQRDWQSRLLPVALEPQRLRVLVNPTNETANSGVRAMDLPMNASLAADLFLLSMSVGPSIFPWPDDDDYVGQADFGPQTVVAPSPSPLNFSTSKPSGMAHQPTFTVPPRPTPPLAIPVTEEEQREQFLRESVAKLAKTIQRSKNISRSDVVMEFSHVDISPTMSFDAVIIEIEIDPTLVADVSNKDNSTRYSNVNLYNGCGPWPTRCLMAKPRLTPTKTVNSGYHIYETDSQVRVFGSCVNANGTEKLLVRSTGLDCVRMSNTSLMVVSIGKRFVADTLAQNKTANTSGLFEQSDYAVVKNLRRIYTYTVAKLSWRLLDLAATFHAKCASGADSCKGLRFPLAPSPTSTSRQPQELIVGAAALPMDLIELPVSGRPSFFPLVRLHEPLPSIVGGSNAQYDTIAGDPLLPHNMGKITWDTEQLQPNRTGCNAFAEERLDMILNNHMYIEHGLQTAYTAATFFLLQNGVVKDVIPITPTRSSLNFQQNTQTIALLASIPDQNARLTIAGCAVLVISLVSVMAWARIMSDRCGGLGQVTTPHVVARVMLDSVHFPPIFLQRRVIGASEETDGSTPGAPTVEAFVMDGLTLQTRTKAGDVA